MLGTELQEQQGYEFSPKGIVEGQQGPGGSPGARMKEGMWSIPANLGHGCIPFPTGVPDHLFRARALVCKELEGK